MNDNFDDAAADLAEEHAATAAKTLKAATPYETWRRLLTYQTVIDDILAELQASLEVDDSFSDDLMLDTETPQGTA